MVDKSMTTERSRAHIFLYTTDFGSATEIIRRTLKLGGYQRLGHTPRADYPRQTLEVKEFFVRDSENGGPVHMVIEDIDQVFFWCLALSTTDPTLPVLGLSLLRGTPYRAKLYQGKTPVFKVGEDPDHELFYPVSPATSRELDRAMELISGGRIKSGSKLSESMAKVLNSGGEPLFTELCRLFQLRNTELAFSTMGNAAEARTDGFRYVCWVRSDSPLLDQ